MALKRKQAGRTETIPVRLYMDHLKEIHEHLSAFCTDPVSIETSEHEAQTPEELRGLKTDSVRELRIWCHEPTYVVLRVNGHGADLSVNKGDRTSIGVYEQVRQVLLKARPWYHWLLKPIWLPAVIALMIFVLGTILLVALDRGRQVRLFYSGFWLAAYPTWVYLTLRVSGRVYVRERRELPSFFRRNKDTILTGLLIAIPTNAVTALITYYLSRD